MNNLQSILAQTISDFIQYKQALNKKYRTETLALQLLDRYLVERNISDWYQINSNVIDEFLISRPRFRPRSYNHLLGVVRRFFDWALLQQLINYQPVTAVPRRETSKRIPYIFDLTMAKRLLEIARNLPDNSRAQHRGIVYETLFALLYGLGLRVSEAARLIISDVDFTRDLLIIRETKFSKNRLVPFGPKMANRLQQYIHYCHGDNPLAETPLFSFTPSRCINPGTISLTFHALLPQLGLNLSQGMSPPRLHDLRHSFAVNTLLRWYRQGIDPNSRLMALATFLGHIDPSSTAVYLTITEELFREAGKRFHSFMIQGGGL
jgi:site-specific recombinase XerD